MINMLINARQRFNGHNGSCELTQACVSGLRNEASFVVYGVDYFRPRILSALR